MTVTYGRHLADAEFHLLNTRRAVAAALNAAPTLETAEAMSGLVDDVDALRRRVIEQRRTERLGLRAGGRAS